MKSRKLLAVLICVAVGLLALSGCNNSQPKSSGASETTASVPEVQVKRDLTVSLPVTYTVSADMDFQDIPGQFDYAFTAELPKLVEHAETIVCGVVQEVTFTSYAGNAFTAISFAVDECYKGDAQQGDCITVLHRGGYIPLTEHLKEYPSDAYLWASRSEEEIANTVLHEVYEREFEQPQVGDHNIYILSHPSDETSLPTEAYWRVRGVVSLLHIELDGESVSRINPDLGPYTKDWRTVQNDIDPYGNEIFSLQDVIDIISAD